MHNREMFLRGFFEKLAMAGIVRAGRRVARASKKSLGSLIERTNKARSAAKAALPVKPPAVS